MATVMKETQYTLDANFEMKDAGLVASSAAAQVDGSDKIADLGASTPFEGTLLVDVSAIEIASNDEIYTILVEGSDSASFASGIEELACLRVGANEVLTGGGTVDSDTGRYEVPFKNHRNTRAYRYIRVYTVVAGTVATGINYTAWIVNQKRN